MTKERGMKFALLSLVSLLLISGIASAGMFDWFGKMTGYATSQNVNVNVTVADTTPPSIYYVTPIAAVTLNEGPSTTTIVLNFSASDVSNLNDSSARINVTKSGEAVRSNTTCAKIAGTTNANYTCSIVLYWFDGAGTWEIGTSVRDSSGNTGHNTTATFTINSLTGFVSAPSALTWSPLLPGGVNQTSSNDPILMNNTGNQDITAGNVQLNTTDLLGESDSAKGIYAGNFSVHTATGGTTECGGTTMASSAYTAISGSTLPHGNFTINDGSTGQEQLYFCIKQIGSELTSQSYSTVNKGAWTVKIA